MRLRYPADFFFRFIYKTKTWEELGPLTTANGEMVSSGDEISKILGPLPRVDAQSSLRQTGEAVLVWVIYSV